MITSPSFGFIREDGEKGERRNEFFLFLIYLFIYFCKENEQTAGKRGGEPGRALCPLSASYRTNGQEGARCVDHVARCGAWPRDVGKQSRVSFLQLMCAMWQHRCHEVHWDRPGLFSPGPVHFGLVNRNSVSFDSTSLWFG